MPLKVIVSGGGTGGHIYPAVSVADALSNKYGKNIEILFVGAEGRMEMERVPAAGYRIVGLPIAGFQRKSLLRNATLPLKMLRSFRKARSVLRHFKPDVVVGFGGYASAPVLWSAQRKGIPTIIQEQNSFAGKTNTLLGKKADRVCVAYSGMERFFPVDKIVMTGNPLRGNFGEKRGEALEYFGLEAGKPVILVTGGSLGTRTLNDAVLNYLDGIVEKGEVQLIWQTGKYYQTEIDGKLEGKSLSGIWRGAFIDRMDYAFAAADVVISRAGASTVSELCLVGKPVIFVPSPNVAEDHQTRNAESLSNRGAAMLVTDGRAVENAIPAAIALATDQERKAEMSARIRELGIPDSAERVVTEIENVLKKK